MKKIFTLLTLAAGSMLGMQAAVPTILFGDTPVEAGKVYERGYTVKEEDYAGIMTFYTYKQRSDLYVQAPKGSDLSFNVTATSNVSVCSFGGCQQGTNINKHGITDASPFDLDIYAEAQDVVMAGDQGLSPESLLNEVTLTVTVWYTDTPAEKATATVRLVKKPQSELGGIENVQGENTFVRLSSGNILNYKFNTPTKLDIYAITGRQVMCKVVSATGSVSLDNLPAGIYIYRAGKHTGKIIVK